MRLALEGVLEECNRLAGEAYSREYANYMKSRLAQLTIDYETGKIDSETFQNAERELQDELSRDPEPPGGA